MSQFNSFRLGASCVEAIHRKPCSILGFGRAILCLGFALALASCGGSGSENTVASAPSASSAPPPSPVAVAASTAGTLRTCGNEGEDACKLLEKDTFNASCDT